MPRRRQPLKMLIIEDNPGDALLFQTFFKQDGRQTTFDVVQDGEEALDYLFRKPPFQKATRPDLVVVDINVPKIDGKDVLREIKNTPSLRTIPVIVLTSSENEEDVRRCYEYGANCVLIKAGDVDQAAQLFELIEKFWVNTVRLAGPALVLVPSQPKAASDQ